MLEAMSTNLKFSTPLEEIIEHREIFQPFKVDELQHPDLPGNIHNCLKCVN